MTALTVYATTVASATIATADQLATVTGGVSTSSPTVLIGTATGFGELRFQGNSSAWQGYVGSITDAALNPTGFGLFLDGTTLDGQTIAGGNWTPTLKMAATNTGITMDGYVRAFIYTSGTYTLIGSAMLKSGMAILTSSAVAFVWSATNQPAAVFPAGSKLYIDVWGNITSNTAASGTTMHFTLSSTLAGLAGWQIVTPGYATTGGVTQPLPYIPRALGGTVVYENRTFVPRALGSVYIPDTVLWVPRAAGMSTLSLPLNSFFENLVASDSAIFTATTVPVDGLSAADSMLMADTALPVDALTASDSMLGTNTAIPVDANTVTDSVLLTDGSLYTEANAASDSMVGQGSGLLTDSLSTADAFLETDTDLAIDALSAGDLGGNLQLWPLDSLVVADTFGQTDSFVPTESTSVLESLLATDVAGWVELLSVSDTSSMVQVGIAMLLFLSATWITRDGKTTWKTRDGLLTWKARDEQAGWNTRDEADTWKTRDEQATWKTRQ